MKKIKIKAIKSLITDGLNVYGARVETDKGKTQAIPMGNKDLEKYFNPRIEESTVDLDPEYKKRRWNDGKVIENYAQEMGIDTRNILTWAPEMTYVDGKVVGKIKIAEGDEVKEHVLSQDIIQETNSYFDFIKQELQNGEKYDLMPDGPHIK